MSVFRASHASAENQPATWSVPNPRPPYADLFDGPTERLYESGAEPEGAGEPPRRRRGGGVTVAVVLALLALLSSAVALVLAWRALAVAGTRTEAGPAPAASRPAPAAAPSAVPSEAPTNLEPEPGFSAEAPVDPSADATAGGYTVSYARQPLTVQVGCASVMYLDLDQPLPNADPQRSDLRYESRCGTADPVLMLGPGAAAASLLPKPDVDPAACQDAIRSSPLGADASVPVRKGTVLCVLTSAGEAEDPGAGPGMVLVEVTDVHKDGSAGLRATSWTVPE